MMPILKRITQYAQELGFEMIQSDYEDPGQLECNFLYDNALATADRLITYRQICMAVAKEFGVLATFMPKPVPGIMANGCHHHASLWRGEENVFADDDDLTELGRHALGGLLEHTRGMTAVFASTTNSYARFWDVGLFAPAVTNWGYDNRTTNYRVLPGRVEVRSPDAAVNPYLSHAALIGAMADGIRRNVDPGKPELGNAYAPSGDDAPSTFAPPPLTLSEALDALEEDKAVRSVLPGRSTTPSPLASVTNATGARARSPTGTSTPTCVTPRNSSCRTPPQGGVRSSMPVSPSEGSLP